MSTSPDFVMSDGSFRRGFPKLKGKALQKRAKRARMKELNEQREKEEWGKRLESGPKSS